jgi:hypothetical protein
MIGTAVVAVGLYSILDRIVLIAVTIAFYKCVLLEFQFGDLNVGTHSPVFLNI